MSLNIEEWNTGTDYNTKQWVTLTKATELKASKDLLNVWQTDYGTTPL